MNIIEKAKAYDEALEKIKDEERLNYMTSHEIKDYLFPELKESEDEIVRKWIINYLNNRILNSSILDEKESCKKALAWLEKQGEKESKGIDFADWDILNYIKDIVREHVKRDEEFNEIDNWLTTHYQEQKPAWSEEDEKISNAIYESIDFLCLKSFGFSEDEVCDWLKSIKPNHWKPSEEQMNALDKAKNSPANYYDIRLGLQSLYNDLKNFES